MRFISSRYIYIIAATSDTNFGRLAKWLTLNSNFHIYLTVLGLTMTAFHGISTIFLASDQFFFDQGKRRYFDQKRFCTEMYEKFFWVKILISSTEIKYIVVWFSACLRPHQELRSRTLGTQMHTYMATMYMFISVGICATLYLKIESVEKYLNTMLKTNFQVIW